MKRMSAVMARPFTILKYFRDEFQSIIGIKLLCPDGHKIWISLSKTASFCPDENTTVAPMAGGDS
jgi:hypothetical protein